MTASSATVLRAVVVVLLTVICVVPVLYGFSALVAEPDSLEILMDPGPLSRLARSFACAVFVAVVATAIGLPLGLAWAGASTRLSAALAVLSAVPLVLPPYVYALAWIELVGASSAFPNPPFSVYSVAGVVMIESLRFAPVAAGCVWFALRYADAAACEASLLHRGRVATLLYVVFPTRVHILLAGPIVISILTITDASVANLLQIDLYPVDIQTRFSAHYDVAGAFALTIPMLMFGVALACVWRLVTARASRFSAAEVAPGKAAPILSNRIAALIAGAYVAVSTGGPVLVALQRIRSVNALTQAVDGLAHEMTLALWTSLAAALCGLMLSISTVSGFRRLTWPTAAAALPILFTGPAFGIGLILFWNHAGWRGAVYDSTAILVLIGVARVALLGFVGSTIGFLGCPPDLDSAAALAGRPALSRLVTIMLPLAAPALCLTAVLMFLFVFSDADAAAMVTPPGATPLAVRIEGLLHYGPSDLIHAASVLSASVALAGVSLSILAMSRIMDRIS